MMNEFVRGTFRKLVAVVSNFSPKVASKIYYKTKIGKKLNLEEPKLFNEKLMWLKLNKYANNPLVTKCVDKYRVREYVKDCGLENILNTLIKTYDSVEEINFEELPNKFVLKCNHGAGYNIICEDKSKLNIKEAKTKLKKWMKEDYWKYVAEVQYKGVRKKIVCEKFLESKDGNSIKDYKIYCFNGEPKFCMLCIERNLGKPKYYFFDTEWNLLRINPAGKEAPPDFLVAKPECMDKMYEVAKTLAKPFEFVRVDLYEYHGQPVFGELTFTPAGCVDDKYIDGADLELGNILKIGLK